MQELLSKRFAQPLPPYYTRRIIVWLDEAVEFKDLVPEIKIDSVEVLIMGAANAFQLRRQIEVDFSDRNILLYCPMGFPKPQDNWLLDVFLYSEEFRADYWSRVMEETGILDKKPLQDLCRQSSSFFKSKERRDKLKALNDGYASVEQLRDGIFSVLCGVSTDDFAGVLRAVLSCSPEEENPCLTAIAKHCGEDAFWEVVTEQFSYAGEKVPLRLACYLLVSAATLTIDEKRFTGIPLSLPFANACYAFIAQWIRLADDSQPLALFRAVEDAYGIAGVLESASRDQLTRNTVFPCVDAILLKAPLTAFAGSALRVDDAENLVAARKDKPWFSLYAAYYEALSQIVSMQAFYSAHRVGFHQAACEAMWKAYAGELYQMDIAYRKFSVASDDAIRSGISAPEDELKEAGQAADNLYKNWFLQNLNDQWSVLLRSVPFDKWRMELVIRQEEFYANYVRPILNGNARAFVIISDAMRYEIAQELTARLTANLGGSAECKAMRGILPSITRFGMAALLPHTRLSMSEDLRILADGKPTDKPYREDVLKNGCSDSAVLDYAPLMQMTRLQRSEAIRNKKVIYIYHNAIDAVGDHTATEGEVLHACQKCLDELTLLTRLIVSEFGGTNIMFTSDHGFLYTRAPLQEFDKAGRELAEGEILESKRRYMLVREAKPAPELLSAALTDLGQPNISAVSPMGCLRFKMPGGGMNYVHGGMSLQEIMIPVIIYKNRREGQRGYQPAEKVGVVLLTESRKVSNQIFSLTFFQKEPVKDKKLPRTALVCFVDESEAVISDQARVVADRTNEADQERTFRAMFHLRGGNYDKAKTYYLQIRDEETGETLSKTPFQLQIVFNADFGI